MLDNFSLIVIIVITAIAFDFINGFHDTANAIATVVSTRVLTPLQAILMAAGFNMLGALTGTAVAKTVASGLVDPNSVNQVSVLAALLAAIIWNLITWYYGIPSSSSHALIGGIIGAAIAKDGLGAPMWDAIGQKVVAPLVLSPIIGYVFALILMVAFLRIVLRSRPAMVNGFYGRAQLASSAFMAYSHGGNDAQKTMGIITLALFSAGYLETVDVPLWVIVTAAIAMALGTAAGGWRIIRTMGTRLAHLTPISGCAAETAAGSIIEIASRLGFPLSTTHVVSSAILGVSSARGTSGVRWQIAGNILTAWILTIPTCLFLGWLIYKALVAIFLGLF